MPYIGGGGGFRTSFKNDYFDWYWTWLAGGRVLFDHILGGYVEYQRIPGQDHRSFSIGVTLAIENSSPSYTPAPAPKPDHNYPKLTEEEFKELNIAYSATIDDIAGKNIIRIEKYSTDYVYSRSELINKFDSPINQKVTNAINAKLETYTDKSLQGVLSQVTITSDVYMKARYIHDWITDNVRYDYNRMTIIENHNNELNKYGSATTSVPHYTVKQTVDNRWGVCMDYALVYFYVAKAAGLDVYYISDGTLTHAYNIIKLEGNYYIIDTTWDAGWLNSRGQFEYHYSKSWFLRRIKDGWVGR
jgi:transglutaminase-like putative cysteine protease